MKRLAALSVLSIVLLTGCGGGDDSKSSGGGGSDRPSEKAMQAHVKKNNGMYAKLVNGSIEFGDNGETKISPLEDDTVECIAKTLRGSELSNDYLAALAEDNAQYQVAPVDQQMIDGTVVPKISSVCKQS
jgi:hypothetical protein